MDNLIRYIPLLASGTLVTIALAVLSLGLATVLGAAGAAAKIGGGAISRAVTFGYTTTIRGIPDLVLLLLVYFGGQRLLNTLLDVFGHDTVSVPPFWAGVATIGFIYGAYLTETFRGAYMTIPAGQFEAAQALGMRGWTLHARVTIPQMIRFALPGYSNVWQVLVKSTAVVSIIGLEDLVGLANDAGKTVREPFVFFCAVMLVYLMITWVSQQIFSHMERRYALVGHNAR